MNRLDFQQIAETRLKESSALLAAGFPDGAYYLAGYAIECALKACIAKRTREHDFPEKKLVNDSHTHDIRKLLQLAGLEDDLISERNAFPMLDSAWKTALDWSEASRYERSAGGDADALLEAVESKNGGLLPWIRQRW